MKKYITALLLSIIFLSNNQVFADTSIPAPVVVKTTEGFSKSYKTSCENLLYLLLSALSEHNYSIEEIQFKTGSVLFKAYSKEFIASVSSQDGYNSFIKIIPVDNNFNFSPILLEKLQNFIELNNNINFQKIL